MKITINRAEVKAKVDNAWKNGLPILSEEILNDCNQYVKVRHHQLEQSAITHSELDKGLLIWETPYAKRQYWEIQTALTPGTTWRWIETAKRNHFDKWKNAAQRGFIDNL